MYVLKPLGNERRHSLSRKDEKRQRKSVKAKGRQAARKELAAYPAIRHSMYDDGIDWRHETKEEPKKAPLLRKSGRKRPAL